MIFSYHEVSKLPIAVIDNIYQSSEVNKIWQELCFLNNDPNKFYNPENTGSAYTEDEDGNRNLLKQNKAVSLDWTFRDRGISNILTINRKLFTPEVTDELVKYSILFRYWCFANSDGSLVSYYENSDYYLPHHDNATMTALTWFYEKPKKFLGGDVIFEDQLKIECKFNRCVIFPSILNHEVEKISMQDIDLNQNLGRYTISQFISFQI